MRRIMPGRTGAYAGRRFAVWGTRRRERSRGSRARSMLHLCSVGAPHMVRLRCGLCSRCSRCVRGARRSLTSNTEAYAGDTRLIGRLGERGATLKNLVHLPCRRVIEISRDGRDGRGDWLARRAQTGVPVTVGDQAPVNNVVDAVGCGVSVADAVGWARRATDVTPGGGARSHRLLRGLMRSWLHER